MRFVPCSWMLVWAVVAGGLWGAGPGFAAAESEDAAAPEAGDASDTTGADEEPADAAEDGPTVLLVIGAPGLDRYAERFAEWADRWEQACAEGGAELVRVGWRESADAEDEPSDRDRLREAIRERAEADATALWIVMIGHGTFDGRSAKFNLRGPDVSASDLASWVAGIDRPLAVINTASASGPFLDALAAPGRVVVTATRSRNEDSFARFGGFFVEAVADAEADLDKDGQVSLLEAFIHASNRVQRSYEKEDRLATEHALLDDNGDGLGTQADWFRGVRATKTPASDAEPDGYRAHQLHLIRSEAERRLSPERRARRNELELEVLRLRDRRDEFEEEEYLSRLEELLIPLARLYREAERDREEGDERSEGESSGPGE